MKKIAKIMSVIMIVGMLMNIVPMVTNAMTWNDDGYHEVDTIKNINVYKNTYYRISNTKYLLDADYTGVDMTVGSVQQAGQNHPIALQVYQKKTTSTDAAYKVANKTVVTVYNTGRTYTLGGYVNYKNGGEFKYVYNTQTSVTGKSDSRWLTLSNSVIWYTKNPTMRK